MTVITFCVLDETNNLNAACHLIEKAYKPEQRLYIHVPTREKATFLDNLLWTFRDESFVPHQLHDPHSENTAPIEIGYNNEPLFPSREPYHEIIEIVFSDPAMQQSARERYKQYRAQGHNITTHKIAQAN